MEHGRFHRIDKIWAHPPTFFMFLINFRKLEFLRYKDWGRFHPNQGEARLYVRNVCDRCQSVLSKRRPYVFICALQTVFHSTQKRNPSFSCNSPIYSFHMVMGRDSIRMLHLTSWRSLSLLPMFWWLHRWTNDLGVSDKGRASEHVCEWVCAYVWVCVVTDCHVCSQLTSKHPSPFLMMSGDP